MEVRPFLRNSPVFGTEFANGVTDPTELVLLYGQVRRETAPTAEDAEARSELASSYYEELDEADYERYRRFMSGSGAKKYGKSHTVPPTAARLRELAEASNLFDKLKLMFHFETGEALLVGITKGDTLRYFKIVQWGESLTTIEWLCKARKTIVLRGIAASLALFAMPLGFIIGVIKLNDLNTEESTREVLVCEAVPIDFFETKWMIETDQGQMKFDPGFYNGKFYDEPSEALAKSLVGKWVNVTMHGGHADTKVYITAATTQHDGSCG